MPENIDCEQEACCGFELAGRNDRELRQAKSFLSTGVDGFHEVDDRQNMIAEIDIGDALWRPTTAKTKDIEMSIQVPTRDWRWN